MSIINAIEGDDHTELAAFLREIYRRAMTDPSFRETALNDPEGAFEAVGGELDGWDVKFVDSEDDVDDVFMLPPAIETAPSLTDAELDAVAGGSLVGSTCHLTDEVGGAEEEEGCNIAISAA